MIDTPHPVHTHSRSALYHIYKVFQLQWLVVIKGCNPSLIYALWVLRVDVLGVEGGVSMGTYD